VTGISLTAVYASAVAVTGLWVRRLTSMVLSVFPSWFRYFLQPVLVLYYAPLFVVRGLTGPTRRDAIDRHDRIVRHWKEAVQYAERTERDGYWPVIIGEDGYFALAAPPSPHLDDNHNDQDGTPNQRQRRRRQRQEQEQQQEEALADAMAETVEHAMEVTAAVERSPSPTMDQHDT
jgi:hypothetical protein